MRTGMAVRITRGIVIALMVSSSVTLTGCLGESGDNENGGKVTKATDRDDWTTVADSSGRVWSTVVKLSPSTGTDLDEAKLVSDLRKAKTFSWIRVICTDNRSTNKQEEAYLFLPESNDYRQIKGAIEELEKKGWKCVNLDVTAYNAYTSEAESSSYDFAETTYESD